MSDDQGITISPPISQVRRIENNTITIKDIVNNISAIVSALANPSDSAKWDELFAKLDTYTQTLSEIFDAETTLSQTVKQFASDTAAKLAQIEQDVNGGEPSSNDAVSVKFLTPIYYDFDTGEEVHMAQPLMNDVISAVLVEFDNVSGQPVAAPAAGAITLSVVDATGAVSPLATAAMSADGTRVEITPASPKGSALGDITVMFDDSTTGSDFKTSADFTMTNDAAAATVRLRTDDITTTPMP